MILMWLLQENSVHYKSIEGNAFWEAVLHFQAIPPQDMCSWWQIVYKAKTSVRASNSSITDHLENPQILCSSIKSSHYMSCGAVSTARALQLFPKSPGALLCVSRKFTSFTRESFSQSAALHFPLKYFYERYPQSQDPSPAEWRSEHTENPTAHKHLIGSVAEFWLLASVPVHLRVPTPPGCGTDWY